MQRTAMQLLGLNVPEVEFPKSFRSVMLSMFIEFLSREGVREVRSILRTKKAAEQLGLARGDVGGRQCLVMEMRPRAVEESQSSCWEIGWSI